MRGNTLSLRSEAIPKAVLPFLPPCSPRETCSIKAGEVKGMAELTARENAQPATYYLCDLGRLPGLFRPQFPQL